MVKVRRRGRRLPDVLTAEEQKALLAQVNPKVPTGLRSTCILRVMLDAGLRVSEVTNLRVRDVDLNTGKIMIREGKGKKDRALWVRGETLDLFRQWMDIKPQSDFFFTTLKGGKLNDRYIRQLVDRVAVKAGIQEYQTRVNEAGEEYQESKVHPHTLRHTFATDFYRETRDIRMTQKALGHSDLSTTMIYTHIVDDDLEEAMKSFRGGE